MCAWSRSRTGAGWSGTRPAWPRFLSVEVFWWCRVANRPGIVSFIVGLGGREVSTDNVIDITSKVFNAASGGGIDDQDTHWIGVRE